jgi:ribosomal protein L16/L10AE
MGKGCGKLDMFLSYIKRGSAIIEVPYVSMEIFFKVFNIIKHKLCLKLDFCIRPPYVKEIYSKSFFVEPKKVKKKKSLKRKNKR